MLDRVVPAALVAMLSCACGKSTPRVDAAGVSSTPTPTQSRSTLAITIEGRGTGAVRVYDSESRITECSRNCAVELAAGTADVMPIPAPGSKFMGWSGACAGLRQCTVSATGATSVTASFDPFPPAPWRYEWVDVSKLEGIDTLPTALDDEGAIAGTYVDGSEHGVFLWDGTLRRIPVPPETIALVAATSGGRAVGTLHVYDGDFQDRRAFIAANGAVRTLDAGGGGTEAAAVSADGTVVGLVDSGFGVVRAVAWKDGVARDLGTLPGDSTSSALAVDAGGTAYGVSCSPDPGKGLLNCSPVRFDDAGPVRLGAIANDVSVVSMTAAGAALLWEYRIQSATRTSLWQGGAIADLAADAAHYAWPTLRLPAAAGQLSTNAQGPNAAGDAAVALWVPISEGAEGTLALWHEGVLYDVNDLVDLGGLLQWPRRIDWARGINAKGQILAHASRAGAGTTLLLTPGLPR